MRGVFTKRQTVCEQGSSFGQCSGVLLNRPGFSVNEDDGDKILTEASWASEKGFLEIFAVDWNGVDSRSGLPLTPVVKVKDFNHYFFLQLFALFIFTHNCWGNPLWSPCWWEKDFKTWASRRYHSWVQSWYWAQGLDTKNWWIDWKV